METSDNPLRVFSSAFSDTSEFQAASVEDGFQLKPMSRVRKQRSLILNAAGKYSIENIQFEAVLVIISILAALIYLGVCIGRVFLGVPANGLFDTVLMFLFSVVVSLDGYIFSRELHKSRSLSTLGIVFICGKTACIVPTAIYFTSSLKGTIASLNVLHTIATIIMLLPAVVMQELQIEQMGKFFGEIDEQCRYDLSGKTSQPCDDNVFDCLIKKKDELQQLGYISSFSLSLTLIFSIVITMSFTAFNLGFGKLVADAPEAYVLHFLIIFGASEGVIRRSSMYNDRIMEISKLIRFKNNFHISILSFKPGGLLLLSYYVGFLIYSLKFLFGYG
jgi:hypothetical protein